MSTQPWIHAEHTRGRTRWSIDANLRGFRRTLIRSARSVEGYSSEEEADATVLSTIGAVSAELRTMAKSGEYTKEVRDAVFETCGPFSLLSYIGRRAITRPRGYRGDFKSIDHVYANRPKGACRIGRGIDRWVLEMPAAQDIRQRRQFLATRIRGVADSHEAARVMSIANGPARELTDALTDARPVGIATCLDADRGALEHVRRTLFDALPNLQLGCVCANVATVVRGSSGLGLSGQHLVYSADLIHYLNDEVVVALLNWMFRLLRPGGIALVGTLSPTNPDKEAMDAMLDWPLVHRSASDLSALFARSDFGAYDVVVHQMDAGVRLVAEVAKD